MVAVGSHWTMVLEQEVVAGQFDMLHCNSTMTAETMEEACEILVVATALNMMDGAQHPENMGWHSDGYLGTLDSTEKHRRKLPMRVLWHGWWDENLAVVVA